MPPKTNTKDLVKKGPAEIQKSANRRQDAAEKPTTQRAIVIRNGKHGARGTGEVQLANKLAGREKLDLLAEDLVEKAKQAIARPFRLEECINIAEAQCSAFLDDIANLQDPDLFYDIIQQELEARTPKDTNGKPSAMLRNPTYVAQVVATRIHNAYLLASAWKIASDTLALLAREGLEDRTVKQQLKSNEKMRSRYLVLFDMVGHLVDMTQTKFAVLATKSPHYAHFFREVESKEPGEKEVIFDYRAGLREAGRSFLDSIIIELAFPESIYPKSILYNILHDAVEEAPREAKRFPQALWDSVGDLSEAVELQQILETPLLGPEGQEMRKMSRQMPEEFERWVDASIYSQKASELIGNFKDVIFPLEKTKSRVTLDNMWKYINMNYKSVAQTDITTLWGLDDALNAPPQWHAYYVDPSIIPEGDEDDMPALGGGRKKPLQLTTGEDSDGSMPELQSVSNSSDEESDDDSSDSEDEESDWQSDDGYDTDQEDYLREMLREAMDAANEAETDLGVPGVDPLAQDEDYRKGNPFLKLLGSLRGRMFPPGSKIKTPADRPAPRNAGAEFLKKAAAPPSQKTALEQLLEEEEAEKEAAAKKKSKKKPKKKKAAGAAGTSTETAAPTSPPPPAAQSPPTSPQSKKQQPKPAAPKPSGPTAAPIWFPTGETRAQSARAYLQENRLEADKNKTKSRPDHASIFSETSKKDKESKKGGLFSKLTGKDKEDPDQKEAKQSFFKRLSKRTKGYMHQLMRTSEDEKRGLAPMKWENFVKLMTEMGFDYDPSTAGSSVRFIPKDQRDKPITFHKPHPDPTIHPMMLREFSKKLQRHYGWTQDDILSAA
ncbi:hypothetical protein BD626DRAFT_533140 [Schizophyllum amplum]|uniref:Uncharacterized protein n=1 Tax=Schizophyllum amplum TaxID=97359 RepID=A0A550CXI0_9AGAR|nr:hypothetical protein BD626DRAFT_533140 [Auriculariopsis ampla]